MRGRPRPSFFFGVGVDLTGVVPRKYQMSYTSPTIWLKGSTWLLARSPTPFLRTSRSLGGSGSGSFFLGHDLPGAPTAALRAVSLLRGRVLGVLAWATSLSFFSRLGGIRNLYGWDVLVTLACGSRLRAGANSWRSALEGKRAYLGASVARFDCLGGRHGALICHCRARGLDSGRLTTSAREDRTKKRGQIVSTVGTVRIATLDLKNHARLMNQAMV